MSDLGSDQGSTVGNENESGTNDLDIVFAFDATPDSERIKDILENAMKDLSKLICEKYADKTVRVAEIAFRDIALALFKKKTGLKKSGKTKSKRTNARFLNSFQSLKEKSSS